jgi:hypothetical protein
LTGSKSPHQTCQKYIPNPFIGGPTSPLLSGWVAGCRAFVGTLDENVAGEISQEFQQVTPQDLIPITVMYDALDYLFQEIFSFAIRISLLLDFLNFVYSRY